MGFKINIITLCLFSYFFLIPIQALASTPTTTIPIIKSVTLTPPKAHTGKVHLFVSGENIKKYSISAECPNLIYLKYGSWDICESSKRLTAKKAKKLWLNLKNPNNATGTIQFIVKVSDPKPTSTPIQKNISFIVVP